MLNKKMSEYNKFKYEDVVIIVQKLGFTLISKTYKNARSKLILKDKFGYLYYSTLSNLSSNKIPNFVSNNNIFTIRNIKHYIAINKLSCELLSTHYNNSRNLLLFKCKCGKHFQCNWGKFQLRQKELCNDCSQKKKAYVKRHDIEIIKKEFLNANYQPLFDTYINCEIPLLCKDHEGYIGFLSYSNLKNGNTFAPFKLKNEYLICNIKQYIKNNEFNCTLITDKLVNNNNLNKILLTFQCECGEIYQTTWQSFSNQHIDRCPICSKKKSKYALMTEKYLKEINCNYESEYHFDDCKDKSFLYFDYIVYSENKFLLIEVDGQFHYTNAFGTDFLESQIKRDSIKNDYCYNNNITLIRIPYWEYSSENYKTILKKGIKLIQS